MLIIIAVCLLFGCLCSSLASKKGRDPFAWFALGFGFGVLGLLAIWLMPPLSGEEKKNPFASEKQPNSKEISEAFWYYLDATHQQVGPLPVSKIKKSLERGDINSATLVWTDGMQDWTPLKNTHLE